jgi:anthranilate 1,2-dioxygenase small subunit
MTDPALWFGVHELIASYAECIDEGRLEEWPDLFVENARYVITNRENHEAGLPHGVVYATSRGMLVDRVTALREANVYEAHGYRHVVGPIRVEACEGGVARVRSNFLVVRVMEGGETALFATGRYLDRIDVSGTPYRFIERIVVADSRRIDTLLVIPL